MYPTDPYINLYYTVMPEMLVYYLQDGECSQVWLYHHWRRLRRVCKCCNKQQNNHVLGSIQLDDGKINLMRLEGFKTEFFSTFIDLSFKKAIGNISFLDGKWDALTNSLITSGEMEGPELFLERIQEYYKLIPESRKIYIDKAAHYTENRISFYQSTRI